MMFSRRTQWRQESNALASALEQLQQQGVPVLDLTASNPTTCGFEYPKTLLAGLGSADNLRYSPDACGMRQAREAVAGHYARRQGTSLPVDQVILTASTSEAYSFLMRLLVNPGEKVLIPRPSYPLFQFLLELNDVAFEQYPLVYEGTWRLDFEALEKLADARTRAIILVNPNNPTGSYISPAQLNRLNEFCRARQIAIISDEVFFDFGHDTADIVSCAGNQAALTFVLGGLSKTMALPQMKCSWMLASGPQDVLKDALSRLEIIADTYLSVNTPVQHALGAWLAGARQMQAQIMARVQANARWLKAKVPANTEVLSLQGGWYATLRIPAVKSEEEWALEFLKQDHVLVYPGYFFDFEREAYIILSLLPEAAVFENAAGRILRRLLI